MGIGEAVKHFEGLQKRYTRQHNGTACEHVKLALEGLARMAEGPEPPCRNAVCGLRIEAKARSRLNTARTANARRVNMAELIDRDALIDGWDGWVDSLPWRLKDAPTIDAVLVVHARWVMRPYFDDGDPEGGGEMVCSHCGERAPIHLDEEQYETPYCKECGARMDADAPERAGKDGRDER